MNKQIFEAIQQQGILPLFFYHDAQVCVDVLKTLYDAGIRVVEFTNRGAEALTNFKKMIEIKNQSFPDLLLSVGTIKNAVEAEQYLDAGADFLISPCFAENVLELCIRKKATWIPGCMTPTEINYAEQKGIRFVKLFPGNLLQPKFMAAIRSLFPDVACMPTGGVEVSEENIRSWFDAGVCAVGMGSKLISKKSLENKDYATIRQLVEKSMTIIRSIKNNN